MNRSLDSTRLVDMDEIVARGEGEPVHLVQTAGPGAERTFRVLPLQRAVIGRSDTSTICVDDGDVSRRHALIEHQDGEPRLIDLASTNGTFVNGQRNDEMELASGDLIQIGTAVFEVSVGRSAEPQPSPPAEDDSKVRQQMESLHEKLRDAPSGSGVVVVQETILSGALEGVGLTSLLQILEANRNTGTLLLHLEPGVGRLHLHKGRVDDATFGTTRGMKALTRLLGCTGGHFELLAPGIEPERPTIEGPLDALLLTAMTEVDEFAQYRGELPPDDAVLVFNPNRFFILSRMPPDLFDVLAAIARHRSVGQVIDECHLSDLIICRYLLMLLSEGIVTVEAQEPKDSESSPG
jgi:pSer/pThr/pTyr-binding forkhead associated (FHA) protein